jgi:hypothetical protein
MFDVKVAFSGSESAVSQKTCNAGDWVTRLLIYLSTPWLFASTRR